MYLSCESYFPFGCLIFMNKDIHLSKKINLCFHKSNMCSIVRKMVTGLRVRIFGVSYMIKSFDQQYASTWQCWVCSIYKRKSLVFVFPSLHWRLSIFLHCYTLLVLHYLYIYIYIILQQLLYDLSVVKCNRSFSVFFKWNQSNLITAKWSNYLSDNVLLCVCTYTNTHMCVCKCKSKYMHSGFKPLP